MVWKGEDVEGLGCGRVSVRKGLGAEGLGCERVMVS